MSGDINPLLAQIHAEKAEAALAPVVLRHGEHVDSRGDIACAIESMVVAARHLKDPNGLRIIVPASVELARKHLTAFLEEALDINMPVRRDPNVVVLKGLSTSDGAA